MCCAAVAADGSFVVTASDDRTARVWDLDTGACAAVLPHLAPLTCLALSSDGQLLVAATVNHVASLWDVGTATCLCTQEGHKDSVTGAAFDGGGFHVATCSRDGTLRYWSTISGAVLTRSASMQ